MPDQLNDILMITFNRPRYTRLSLARLLDTCDESCRVWLWQNGDHPETVRVVEEFRDHPNIFKFEISPENVGQNRPIRWVFEEGTSRFVTKVDDDCLMPFGWVETLRDAHAENPEFGVLGTWRFPEEHFVPEVASQKIKLFRAGHRLMLNSWIEGSGFVLKRACIDAHGNVPTHWSFPRYCVMLAAKGWVNGWYFPFLYQEHMDHPWSEHTMFKSDEDLRKYLPVNAKRWNVSSLAQYEERFRQEAYRLQVAPPDARRYFGWRARVRRLQRLAGPKEKRDRVLPTPLETAVKRFRDKYRPGEAIYYRSPWVNARYVSDRPIVVVGGCERSGTTLLRAVLDSHPEIEMGPESWVFAHKLDLEFLAEEYDFSVDELATMKSKASGLAEFVDMFAEKCCARSHKRIWGEKSPKNVFRLSYIWRHFPNARFVHVIRDGRDVACSLRNHPKRIRIGDRYYPTKIDRPIESCITTWVDMVSAGIKHRGDPRYLEIAYEDLVADYSGTARKMIQHVGLEWSDDCLIREEIQEAKAGLEIVNPEVRGPLYSKAVARWRTDLSASDLEMIDKVAGDLLNELGYDS